MTDEERKRIEETVKHADELQLEDLKWKPLYPNNMPVNGQEGVYCLVTRPNGDGTYTGRKYTIYYQLPVNSEGILISSEPELYILFEKCYSNLVNTDHPEPNDNAEDLLGICNDGEEFLTSYEVNDYGSFHRAYKDIEDAKRGALNCYKGIFAFALSHML